MQDFFFTTLGLVFFLDFLEKLFVFFFFVNLFFIFPPEKNKRLD